MLKRDVVCVTGNENHEATAQRSSLDAMHAYHAAGVPAVPGRVRDGRFEPVPVDDPADFDRRSFMQILPPTPDEAMRWQKAWAEDTEIGLMCGRGSGIVALHRDRYYKEDRDLERVPCRSVGRDRIYFFMAPEPAWIHESVETDAGTILGTTVGIPLPPVIIYLRKAVIIDLRPSDQFRDSSLAQAVPGTHRNNRGVIG